MAQGRQAYRLFLEKFTGPRWEALAAKGPGCSVPCGPPPRPRTPTTPTWLYVDTLIGPDTVNTMPDTTIADFLDHGTVARTVDTDLDEADRAWPSWPSRDRHGRRGGHPGGRRGGLVRQVLRRAHAALTEQGQPAVELLVTRPVGPTPTTTRLAVRPAGRHRSRRGPVRPDAFTKAPPVALVIFGASGDLAARKIFPALARLAERGALDNGFVVIGVARTAVVGRGVPRARPRGHAARAATSGGPIVGRFRYVSGEYDDPDTFAALKASSTGRPGGRYRRQPRCTTWPPSLPSSAWWPRRWPRTAATNRARTAPSPAWWWRSPSDATWPAPSSSTRSCTPPSTRTRSSASTTTWARRRSRTCSPSGSPTPSSSRPGTAATSSRSRSPWPRASGWSTAAASTRRPARCGTSSRTTSCRCWPSP